MMDEEQESFEYMCRKLWCDVVLKILEPRGQLPRQCADGILKEFDQRFGKGDGE